MASRAAHSTARSASREPSVAATTGLAVISDPPYRTRVRRYACPGFPLAAIVVFRQTGRIGRFGQMSATKVPVPGDGGGEGCDETGPAGETAAFAWAVQLWQRDFRPCRMWR